MYVEISNHILIYNLIDETIKKTGNLTHIEKALKPYGFIRCHSAFLVNPILCPHPQISFSN